MSEFIAYLIVLLIVGALSWLHGLSVGVRVAPDVQADEERRKTVEQMARESQR